MDNSHEFRLSFDELRYLMEIALPDIVARELRPGDEVPSGGRVTVQLSLEKAEQLRGCLTERLATFGFANDYSLNEEGRMLEKLIDRFYIR